MSRILIIEDNADLAFGLRSNLELEGYEVVVAATGPSGLEQARRTEPDLVVLDLMLPGMDGFSVLRQLRQDDTSTPILVLTARAEEVDKVRGLRSGADDYVTKPFGLMELLARIEALLRRSSVSGEPGTIVVRDIRIDVDSRRVERAGRAISLAPKEFDLLVALVRKNGAVVSRTELMRAVWGHSAAVVSRTVDTHVAELRRKLGDSGGRDALIVTVRKAGYRLDSG